MPCTMRVRTQSRMIRCSPRTTATASRNFSSRRTFGPTRTATRAMPRASARRGFSPRARPRTQSRLQRHRQVGQDQSRVLRPDPPAAQRRTHRRFQETFEDIEKGRRQRHRIRMKDLNARCVGQLPAAHQPGTYVLAAARPAGGCAGVAVAAGSVDSRCATWHTRQCHVTLFQGVGDESDR